MAEPASRVGRYEILREIGRGAMGIVYEARDPALDRTVALKVIQPSAGGDAARVLEERFLAEARIAARLQHPGIVVVHDVGVDPSSGSMFIALELLRGQTLADLGGEGPLDWRTVLRLTAQVARALGYAHAHGVVHRDIKPANVFVLPTGEAKVMDFGIARLESDRQRLTTKGEFIGTPLYTAPEQARNEDVDGRADVFSLGSVAYTLLTGQAAFLAPSIPGIVHRIVYEEPDPLSGLVSGLPPDVERVLACALEKEPARRYPTAEAFADDAEDVLAGRPPRHAGTGDHVDREPESPLEALLDGDEPPLAPSAPQPSPTQTVALRDTRPPASARRRAFVVAAAAALLVVLALPLWLARRPPASSANPVSPRRAGASATPRAQPSSPAAAGGPLAALLPAPPGRLRIDLDHPLKNGSIRVFVDDQLALEEELKGQERTTALVFRTHAGSFREDLEVRPGLHEVRVEVRWDENVRSEHIIGKFRPGVTRRLEASLGRIRHDLDLQWK
ncbi:MAG TPA: serine/threonine-protein kinase [Vicinamibacteria bacterium]|nr:serine/threonine-protein kinase [Vicinamibacteria bacterium]